MREQRTGEAIVQGEEQARQGAQQLEPQRGVEEPGAAAVGDAFARGGGRGERVELERAAQRVRAQPQPGEQEVVVAEQACRQRRKAEGEREAERERQPPDRGEESRFRPLRSHDYFASLTSKLVRLWKNS